MVAAGNALPVLMAAQLVRPVIEGHNRSNAKPMGFYDTVRLLAFFLRRATSNPSSSCVAVVGFLESGRPAIAHLVVSPDRNRVAFFSVDEGECLVIPVGNSEASKFLMQGLAAARKEGKLLVATGVSLLWYMSCHPGAFQSVGGSLSIGSCVRSENYFSWPHFEIGDRRFYRGMDVTDYARPSWPAAEVIAYDEEWCATLDKQLYRNQDPVTVPDVQHGGGYDIDSLSTPETLFQTHDDPIAFRNGVACEG